MNARRRVFRGKGSVWAESGGWRARDPVGEKRWFRRKRDAEDWLRQRRSTLRWKGVRALVSDGSRPALTYGELWAWYVEDGPFLEKPASTQRIERQAWARALRWTVSGRMHPVWATTRVADVSTELVSRYRRFRAESAHSASTVAQEVALLRYLTRLAAELGFCEPPNVRWSVPRPVARRPTPVTPDDFARLLAAASPRQAALLQWLRATGARPNEIPLIRRQDFQPDLGTVRIPNPKVAKRSGSDARTFMLTDEMVEAIRRRDRWLREVSDGLRKGAFRVGRRQAARQLESEFLFPGVDGGPMARDGCRAALKSAYRKAGFRGVDLYAHRHGFCARWLASGGDPVTLARLTATSVEMIGRTYGGLSPDWVRTIQARMREAEKPDPEGVSEPHRLYEWSSTTRRSA